MPFSVVAVPLLLLGHFNDIQARKGSTWEGRRHRDRDGPCV